MSFAFKIDKALKANLYKICRLCGIDRDETVCILGTAEDPVDCDGDLEFHLKIQQCIGIMVTKDDKMPQNACTLCVDKINDFYEFREMCYATDVQTRKLLGLKAQNALKKVNSVDIKPVLEVKEEPASKRGRKRKSDDTICKEDTQDVKREPMSAPNISKKQRLADALPVSHKKYKVGKQLEKKETVKPKEEIKDEPSDMAVVSSAPAPKFRQVCNICDERFGSKVKLEQHLAAAHIPSIPRYVCTACNETIKKTNDIKSHQLWHKLSKTPYVCGLCNQSLTSSYAYSRHLRDHSFIIPSELWILDRECPQCHVTFVTNFLYNTHPCAVRTKKCAGCNRLLRNELEYQRHAAHCSKTYLTYSKHISAAAVVAESCVRIKNENEVEAAAAAEALARSSGVSLDMTPVVSLTRISTPEIMAATHGGLMSPTELADPQMGQICGGKSGKKSTKKGVSRKDLKRVDELLKNTLDVLVSIKHEPEVHVDTDVHEGASTTQTHVNENESENENTAVAMDDFHHGDNDDDDDDNDNCVGSETATEIVTEPAADCTVLIKKEQSDFSYKEHHDGIPVQVKQEIVEVDGSGGDTTIPIAKMPVLKLKIKKEHGTLNSSLVDEQNVLGEKKRKKKKRKETEKNRGKSSNQTITDAEVVGETNPQIDMVLPIIKQERLDDTEMAHDNISHEDEEPSMQPEATVMTSIPITQFQITAVSSGVEFNEGEGNDESEMPTSVPEPNVSHDADAIPDIKPDREELDRMFTITNISSGVEMVREIESQKEQVAAAADSVQTKSGKHKVSPNKATHRPHRAKAVKSTGGINKSTEAIKTVASADNVESYQNIRIKPEPVDRGYEDVCKAYETAANVATTQMNEYTIDAMEEQDYINSIDFTNIKIKEEKGIEVSEVELNNTEIVASVITNGLNDLNRIESHASENEDESNEASDETDTDDDQEFESEREEEVREYREMEMPPLLSTSDNEEETPNVNKEAFATHSADTSDNKCLENMKAGTIEAGRENPTLSAPFVITGVYSQAVDGAISNFMETDEAMPLAFEDDTSAQTSPSNLKISNVEAGCTSFVNIPDKETLPEVEDMSKESEVLRLELMEDKEALLNAQPFANDNATCSNIGENVINTVNIGDSNEVNIGVSSAVNVEIGDEVNAVEEQQNVLNQEVASLAIHSGLEGEHLITNITTTTTLPNDTITLSLVSQAQHATNLTNNVEETENLMNESAAEAQRRLQEQRLVGLEVGELAEVPINEYVIDDGHGGGNVDADEVEVENDNRLGNEVAAINHFMLDDSNINEIAENNNNANIERELQDDVAAAEQHAAEH